jgi:hypothetical protein
MGAPLFYRFAAFLSGLAEETPPGSLVAALS